MNNNDNVHQFDGLLKDDYVKMCDLDNKYLKNEISFSQCLNEILSSNNDKVINIINKIILSPESNYDSANNINFTDLFPRVWKFYRIYNSHEKCVFFDQIIEMESGLCSQGRTTRIFQIYRIWIDELENYIKDNKSIDKDIKEIFSKLLI